MVRARMGENPLRPTFRVREGGKGLVLGVVNDLRHKYYELAIKNMKKLFKKLVNSYEVKYIYIKTFLGLELQCISSPCHVC